MTTRDNSHFVIATLSEFLKVWDLGEDASLHLETTQGHVTMAFSCKLGLPSAPHPIPTFPPPPPASVKPHHRGPAQREKNRQRAALYQAAKVVQKPAAPAVTSSLSAPTTVSVVNTHPAPITAPVITPSPTPVTTSAPVVACSPSITTPVSISSPAATPTPFTGPVFGPSIPFIWIVEQLWEGIKKRETELPLECDKCQFSCMPFREMQDHRKEKHRLWECSRCGDSFINQQSFDEHGRGSRKWNYNCVEHPFVSTYVRTSF